MKKFLAIAALMFSLAAIALAGGSPAGAQGGYNYYDWGWVQGYYGGVHMYMYDTCPYTIYKSGCREWHTDHSITATGQLIQNVMYLPENIWITAIYAGQAGGSPAVTRWDPWNIAPSFLVWNPSDVNCPSGPTCGNPTDGVWWQDYPSGVNHTAGNTVHNRYVTVLPYIGSQGYMLTHEY